MNKSSETGSYRKIIFIDTDLFQVLSSPHFDENSKISDFCDGEVSIHPRALQIFLYYDDFEVTNPLTSKTIVLGKK